MNAERDRETRSENMTRSRIIAAAIKAMGNRGIAGFTHRAVAEEGRISLASLTYHFESKDDLIDQVSASILDDSSADFIALRARVAKEATDRASFADLSTTIIAAAVSEHREETMAWLELMLHGGRDPEAAARARKWFAALHAIWTEIADLCGQSCPAQAAQSAIDQAAGFILIAVGLGLESQEILDVLRDGADPVAKWNTPARKQAELTNQTKATPQSKPETKAEQTRRLIVEAAMNCFVEEGLQNVGYRTIAERSGLSKSAPYYYFPKIADLLRQAQSALFEHSKERFRGVLAGTTITDADGLADLTAAILQREVTRYALHNLANFSFWLEAGRDRELVPIVWAAVRDQQEAWLRRLSQAGLQPRPLDALKLQANFAGMSLRLVATESSMSDIAEARRQFRVALQNMDTRPF